MKRKLFGILTLVLCFVLFAFLMTACDEEEKESETKAKAQYTIQYADDTGAHSLTVEDGDLFSLDRIPKKDGYEFLGLFDAEEGGVQYVSAGGQSLSAFTDGVSMTLFPQFKAKEYTVVLDYAGAAVTGSREIRVSYDSIIGELPTNLQKENMVFTGWYTELDQGGTQIADAYGILPDKKLVNAEIYDLSDKNGFIRLYAGFKKAECTVTFYVGESPNPEEITVEYGTPISDIYLDVRVDGMAVLSWSKIKNDKEGKESFTGKITSDMILYSAELAPVITLNTAGGDTLTPIVKRAGETLTLPTPTRQNYFFLGWTDENGNDYTSTVMPQKSCTLQAVWQAMLVLDENGGTPVDDISLAVGAEVVLPTLGRSGYIFAGWYDKKDGKKYTETSMPAESVELIARYCKIKSETIVLIDESEKYGGDITNVPKIGSSYHELDLSHLYSKGVRTVHVTVYYEMYTNYSGNDLEGSMNWYSQATASDAYKVWSYSATVPVYNTYYSFSHETTLELTGGKLHICRYDPNNRSPYWRDFYIVVEYPDMTELY